MRKKSAAAITTEVKEKEVKIIESSSTNILALGLDSILRDPVLKKPNQLLEDASFTAELQEYYFGGKHYPDPVYKDDPKKSFDRQFSLDPESGYQKQFQQWLAAIIKLSTAVKFEGVEHIKILITHKIARPSEYYNFKSVERRDKVLHTIKEQLEVILFCLIKKYQLLNQGFQSVQQNIIAILDQVAATSQACTSNLKSIQSTYELLTGKEDLANRIYQYKLEVILPQFYQECIDKLKLKSAMHAHVEDNARMFADPRLGIDPPPAADDFAEVKRTKRVIGKIKKYVIRNLIAKFQRDFTFDALCLNEVRFQWQRGCEILKKYKDKDLNSFIAGSNSDSIGETIQLSRALQEEFRDLLYHQVIKESDILAFDEEDDTQLILNPDFEVNLFRYYMDYVPIIMYQQGMAGYFMDYEVIPITLDQQWMIGEVMKTELGMILFSVLKAGYLFKAKTLIDAEADPNIVVEKESSLSIILKNFNSEEKVSIYKCPNSQNSALKLLLSAKQILDIEKLSAATPHLLVDGIVSDTCYPEALETFLDWTMSQKSGSEVLKRLLMERAQGEAIEVHALRQAIQYPIRINIEKCLLLLKRFEFPLTSFTEVMSMVSVTDASNFVAKIVRIIIEIQGKRYDSAYSDHFQYFSTDLVKFMVLLTIINKQCHSSGDYLKFFKLIAERSRLTLKEVLFLKKFYPGLDLNRARTFPFLAYKIIAPPILMTDNVADYKKLLEFDDVNPNLRYGNGMVPIVRAMEIKDVRLQKAIVDLLLANKNIDLLCVDFQGDNIMQRAANPECRQEVFARIFDVWLQQVRRKDAQNGDPALVPIRKVSPYKGTVLEIILKDKNTFKLKILLTHLCLIDDLCDFVKIFHRDLLKKSGDYIGDYAILVCFLVTAKKSSAPENILRYYVLYCGEQYQCERHHQKLTLPPLSSEISKIITMQVGGEKKEFISKTIDEFNGNKIFQFILATLIPDAPLIPIKLKSEFQKAAEQFLIVTRDEKTEKINEEHFETKLDLLISLYIYKIKVNEISIALLNKHLRLYQFLLVLLRTILSLNKPESYIEVAHMISTVISRLERLNSSVAVEYFCNELAPVSMRVENEKILCHVLNNLEKKLRDFVSFAFDVVTEIHNNEQLPLCTDLYLYFVEILGKYDKIYTIDHPDAQESRIKRKESHINFALRKCNNNLLKKLLTTRILNFEMDSKEVILPILTGFEVRNEEGIGILLDSGLSLALENLVYFESAVKNNISLSIIVKMMSGLKKRHAAKWFKWSSLWSASASLIQMAIGKKRWDVILFLTSQGMPYDFNQDVCMSNKLYLSVRNIIIALNKKAKLSELIGLLSDFYLACKIAENPSFSILDLIHVIQYQINPRHYQEFLEYLFDQYCQNIDISKDTHSIDEILKELIKLLEVAPLHFICDAIRVGNANRVVVAFHYNANPNIIDNEHKVTPLQLLIWNSPAPYLDHQVDSKVIFPPQVQISILVALLARSPNLSNEFSPWLAIFNSRHCDFFTEYYFLSTDDDYSRILELIIRNNLEGRPLVPGVKQLELLVKFLAKQNYQYIEREGNTLLHYAAEHGGSSAVFSLLLDYYKLRCQDAMQSENIPLLSQLLAVQVRDPSSTDDAKTSPVCRELCRNTEWLQALESKIRADEPKQFLLFFTQPPVKIRIIFYLREILPKVSASSIDLTSLHESLLKKHTITLEDINQWKLSKLIFEKILQPRIKLPAPVQSAMTKFE